jgi:thiamine-phosphate pyrophosphorylase
MLLPPLYAIIDYSLFTAKADPVAATASYAGALIAAGVTLVQFRDKSSPAQPRRFLGCARELRRVTLNQARAMLIVNDRLDLCLAAGADGVHLGQDDLSPVAARKIFDSVESHPLSQSPEEAQFLRQRMGRQKEKGRLLIGYSTHNLDQVHEAEGFPVDYIAFGPVFATRSKANPDPVVGVEGVRSARRLTTKPLVAIGGITRQNCREVRDAGADSVAVISDLFESPGKAVADFLRILE